MANQQLRKSKNRNANEYLKSFLTPNKSLETSNADQSKFRPLNIDNIENIQLRVQK